MNTNNSKYKLFSYLFILLTLFILFLFTKNIYFDISSNKAMKEEITKNLEEKNKEYEKISKIKSDIDAWKFNDLNLDKFLINFDEDDLIDYFYWYANKNPSKIKINSISFSKWEPNEFWFLEWQIDLNASFENEKDMLEIIDSLIINSSKYNFYVLNFSYPMWNISWTINQSIPIKVLYK